MLDLIWLPIAIMNGVGFIFFGIDKWLAVHDKWRISERTLFMLAILFGSFGCYAGMHAFHHKTRKPLFVWGIPLLLLTQTGLLLYVFGWRF